MQPKLIAAALTLALGLTHGGPVLAAGDPPARAAAKRPAAPAGDMLARTVFQALLGEFALQRGDAKLGSDAWSDLAVRTRDPKVIARAIEIAGFTRQYDRALELSRLWISVEPDSVKANRPNPPCSSSPTAWTTWRHNSPSCSTRTRRTPAPT
jgi:hypothetical protein